MLNKTAYLPRAIALVLLFVLALALALSVSADSGLDLSHPTSPYNKELGGEKLLELYGIALSDVEREYLEKYSTVTLKYDDSVTTANVAVSLDGTTLTVTAKPYTYISRGGEPVSWLPDSCRFGDTPLTFTESGGIYCAALEGVDDATHGELSLSVGYKVSFTVSSESLTELLNQAYSDASLWVAYNDYLNDLEQYGIDNAAYLDYLEEKYAYDDALAAYSRYLDDLAAYESAVENNNSYDSKMEEYNNALVLYREYLEGLEDYEAELLLYEDYLARCAVLKDQLSAVEAIGIKMTDDRDVYSAVMGSTVTDVLANKHLLMGSAIGASEEVIDAAGLATESLRDILPAYFALTTFEDRYAFYIENYEAIRDNITLLLKSLDALYRQGRVRETLILEGKDRKYIILVAQLAYIANALNDGHIWSYYMEYTYGSSFTIEGQTVEQILEYKSYLVDTGASSPDPEGYPEPMAEPIAPDPVEEPTRPERVEVPAYPKTVENPGDPPTVVDEPKKPETVSPPHATEDGKVPEEALAIISAKDNGTLPERAAATEPLVVTLDKSVTKQVFGATTHTVFFYDAAGSIIASTEADSGTLAIFSGELPTRLPDTENVYTFDKWVDADGIPADLECVRADLELYPSFKASPRPYAITYIVDGEEIVRYTPYGEIPSPDFTPTKEPSDKTVYVHTGWSEPLTAVLGEATYTAVFEERYIVPLGDGGAVVTHEGGTFYVDCSGVEQSSFETVELLRLAAASLGSGIVLESDTAALSISYTTAKRMLECGDTAITITTRPVSYGYSYLVEIGESGESYTLTAKMPHYKSDTESMRLGFTEGGVRTYVRGEADEDSVSFLLDSGTVYEYVVERTVNLLPSKLVTVTLSRTTARPGDTVRVEYTAAEGIVLDKMYLIMSDGTELAITGGEFTMPDDDVTLGLRASVGKYKIVFKSGEKTIATYTYQYGATVVPPKNPKRAQDAEFSYTFVGWANADGEICEIPSVTEGATYYAVFEATPLPEKEDEGLLISEGVLKKLIIIAAVAFLVLAAIVTVTVVIIVRIVKKRSGTAKP